MTEDSARDRFPVSVDVSAKAEISATVPEKSIGRTLDALTDIIRPFTEKLGLRADRVRLQREDVLIEIARKARARLEIEGAEIRPVPLRVMVPLLERASLADPGDTALIDAWASLLQSASQHENANYGLFIDVLSKLDPAHLRFLEHLMSESRTKRGAGDAYMDIDARQGQTFISETFDELESDGLSEQDIVDEFHNRAKEFFNFRGCALWASSITAPEQLYELESDFDYKVYPERLLDALVSINLVDRVMLDFSTRHFSMWLIYIVISDFGYAFYDCCRPRDGEAKVEKA
ncbi:MAG: hypothetical protein KUL88_16330 [Rhizobium sp.]|nr:hypothetical protein [Rhizobium sp.]